MRTFEYKAVDDKGHISEGFITAETEEDAKRELYSQDLIPLYIREKETSKKRKWAFSLSRPPSQKEVLIVYESLYTLLGVGVPMDRALRICSQVISNSVLKRVVEDILKDVQTGSSLSDALSKYPKFFQRLHVNMIKAGEATGALPQALERISNHLRRNLELRETLISSLTYPAFLAATGIISVGILIIFVVPRFYQIFDSMDITPPFPLPQLYLLGSFVSDYWPFIFLGCLAAAIIAKRWISRQENTRRIYKVSMNAPILGQIVIKIESAKLSRNLGTLIENGVPILKAVSIVKEMFTNPFYRDALETTYRLLREGKKLSYILSSYSAIWHPMVIGLCEVGEESGTLGEMLVKAADSLEKDIETSLTRYVSIVEPVVILAMGLIIGVIIVSMINAIFSVNEIVR